MIWHNIELFNITETESRLDGALRLYRFSDSARKAFSQSREISALSVGNLTTGCELRFGGDSAHVLLSAQNNKATVEIYRGDFFYRVETLEVGVVKSIELRKDSIMDSIFPSDYQGRFSPNVWRIIFGHDCSIVVHDVQPLSEIRPPLATELPKKKILAYGSSITHSACSVLYTNSYVYNVGRLTGTDVLCKGMGGNCLIQKEVADYISQEDWDIAMLELGINMVDNYPVEVFKERANYLIKHILEQGKPVVLISNFMCMKNLSNNQFHQANNDYVACLEELYKALKCDNLYYIRGQEILNEWDYLSADLIHPNPFGHVEMGRKIAAKLKEFGIL